MEKNWFGVITSRAGLKPRVNLPQNTLNKKKIKFVQGVFKIYNSSISFILTGGLRGGKRIYPRLRKQKRRLDVNFRPHGKRPLCLVHYSSI